MHLYETRNGKMFVGSCEDVMGSPTVKRRRGKVQLIFTSPPFVLNRKKKYGNLTGREYVAWLGGLSPLFTEFLTADGSIVIELGNAWETGQPTMSTLAMEALLEFKKNANLHLCQEFVCYNPARLPTPAQWVNVERIRVKDAFTRVWWMSPTPRPKADNRRVLTKYSESMEKLLERGTYNSGLRPSQHVIGGRSFLTDNGGAIPPNVLVPPETDPIEDAPWRLSSGVSEQGSLLVIPNTGNMDAYQRYCRDNEIQIHPARMQPRLVSFFIEMLTDRGDLVLDPFSGSNTTGWVAEKLGRRWIGIERNTEYAEASRYRFEDSCA